MDQTGLGSFCQACLPPSTGWREAGVIILLSSSYPDMKKALLFFTVCFLVSCYEPREGCLDLAATNFDASSDDPCSNCCNYPNLSLNVAYSFGDQTFRYDSVYNLNGTDAFQIARLRFFLSEFSLHQGNNRFTISDSIPVGAEADGQFNLSDIVLISPDQTSTSYTLGAFLGFGQWDSLTFRWGLSNEVVSSDTLDWPEGYLLSTASDSIYFNDSYQQASFWLKRDTLAGTDTTSIHLAGNDISHVVSLPWDGITTLGENTVFPLGIDFEEWLSGIDIRNATIDEIKNKIVQQAPNAFSVVQ